jgi:hypothetical protein
MIEIKAHEMLTVPMDHTVKLVSSLALTATTLVDLECC